MTTIKSVARRGDLPYKLNGSVGSGGYATVLDVSRVRDGVQFAMKVMHTQKRTRAFIMETLREEIKNLKALESHSHFIRVYEAYETKTEVGLVMWPLADQRSLAHCIQEYLETGDISFESIFDRAFGCLANGLAFMHQKGIRHKDIKPENILVHAGAVLYCDFGRSHDSNLFASSTTEGPAHTTRMYMAPEVMACEPRNSKSDVYSLGCVFLELYFALEAKKEINVTSFSKEMPALHDQLADLMPSLKNRSGIASNIVDMMNVDPLPRPSSLHLAWSIASNIADMTNIDPLVRPSSIHLAWSICSDPRFCCKQCRLMFRGASNNTPSSSVAAGTQPKPKWKWSEAHKRYYHATHDIAGKLQFFWSIPYPVDEQTDPQPETSL